MVIGVISSDYCHTALLAQVCICSPSQDILLCISLYEHIYGLIPIHSQFSPALVRLLPAKGDQWELVSSHFKIGTKLGEGNYGQVYKGTLSVEVSTIPAKMYIARQTASGKQPYTVAVKLLKGVHNTLSVSKHIG